MNKAEVNYSNFFGQRCHIITARKEHICRTCEGIIKPNTKCIRVFRPLSNFLYNKPIRKGWIQLFYHIECVDKKWEEWRFKQKYEYEEQIKKCQSRNCANFKNGHCFIEINGRLYVDWFNLCSYGLKGQ